MVKNQAALRGGIGSDLFADDDPLAELARIVGFDAPAAKPQAETRAEPAFDLEEELLREFETYRGPESNAPPFGSAEHVAYAPNVAAEKPAAVLEPESFSPVDDGAIEPDLGFDEAEYVDGPELDEQPVFSADVRYPDVQSPEAQFPQPQSFDLPPMPWEEAYTAEPDIGAGSDHDTALGVADDLASELELAIADIPPVTAGVDAPMRPATAARLSLPLANFSVSARPSEPETPIATVEPTPPMAAAPTANIGAREFEWPPVDLEEDATLLAELELAAELDGLPDLKALDTDFTVSRAAAPMDAPHLAPQTGHEPNFDLGFADALAADEETLVARVPEQVSAPSVAAPETRADLPVDETFDPFTDEEFELSLDDLELDLSEFGADEPVASQAPNTVAPVVAAPIPVSIPSPAPAYNFSASSVAAAPLPAQAAIKAPVPGPAQQPMAAAPVDDMALPFDPTQISEQDDHPAAIPVLDVPEMPAPQVEEAPVYKPEYDFDIDSELASLFSETPVAEAAPAVAAAAVAAVAPRPSAARVEPQAQAAASRAAPSVADDFDAFEKALEDDFRETLGRSQQPSRPRPTRVAIEEVDDAEPSRSAGRRLLLAASVAAVAVLAAGGGYYWLSGGTASVLTSGEPPIILADKDPIKVVPENPGGASVPNQDKAVYDRVAGTVEDPKQEALISGSEEPVDVVQKTLMPENLPLEGENDVDLGGTPVGETEDPRLLPGGQPAEATGDPAEPEAVAIAPRKVRTMIVKADGTLVAQEVEAAPAEPATAASDPAPQPAPAQLDAPAAPAATPAAAPPAETEQAVAAQPAAPAEEPAQTSAPLPTARPAEQPVNIVGTVTDQGNVRPTTPNETAAAQPAATETPAAPPPAGGYYIQIASLPSEAEAQRSYQSLSSRYGNVIGGKGVDIKKADIAGKGTYYRVRIPAGTKAEAVTLCERYRSAGGTCLVAK